MPTLVRFVRCLQFRYEAILLPRGVGMQLLQQGAVRRDDVIMRSARRKMQERMQRARRVRCDVSHMKLAAGGIAFLPRPKDRPLLQFRRPSQEIAEELQQCSDTRKRQDEDDRPGERCRVIEEDDEEAEPEASAPWARKKRGEGAEERILRIRLYRIANEFRDDVVTCEACQSEDGEREEAEIAKRDISGQ